MVIPNALPCPERPSLSRAPLPVIPSEARDLHFRRLSVGDARASSRVIPLTSSATKR